MSGRVDFSANANVYDHRHGALLSDENFDHLWRTARLRRGVRVLDIGAGTGRVAIPFARRECTIVAIEPAREMLAHLQVKAGNDRVVALVAEGSALPFPSRSFDVVVIARLLYLTPDWRAILREGDRVLAAGGCLLHEWGNGRFHEEWVQIREQARTLFEAAGVQAPFHPGVRSETEVDQELQDLQFVPEHHLDLGPGPILTLHEFLRRLLEGELSYIWTVPNDVRSKCLPSLRSWAEKTFDLERSVPIPESMCWTVYRKGSA